MGAEMVIRLKFTPYYVSLVTYLLMVFLLCGALRSAADSKAATDAIADNYLKQDLKQIVMMNI